MQFRAQCMFSKKDCTEPSLKNQENCRATDSKVMHLNNLKRINNQRKQIKTNRYQFLPPLGHLPSMAMPSDAKNGCRRSTALPDLDESKSLTSPPPPARVLDLQTARRHLAAEAPASGRQESSSPHAVPYLHRTAARQLDLARSTSQLLHTGTPWRICTSRCRHPRIRPAEPLQSGCTVTSRCGSAGRIRRRDRKSVV